VITDNAYNNPQQVAFLVGIGNSGATAKVSTASLGFGNQNLGTTSLGKNLTLSNTGSAALNINSILSSGDFSQTNNCPSSLNPSTNCTVTVTFAPSATGSRQGYVTINDTDPAFLQSIKWHRHPAERFDQYRTGASFRDSMADSAIYGNGKRNFLAQHFLGSRWRHRRQHYCGDDFHRRTLCSARDPRGAHH
jgi:hypothetical protein